MYKVQIADLVVFCETPEEVMALAAKHSGSKPNATGTTPTVAESRFVNGLPGKLSTFVNTISHFHGPVSTEAFANALGTSANGVGPIVFHMCKQYEGLKEVITRIGPPGHLGRWVVNHEALKKFGVTAKSA